MKIVISGYYGFGNAGDEAILEAMLADLRAVDRNIRPIVLSADPEGTAERYGVEAASRLRWREVRQAIRGAALFISGGGSLLQDATGWGSVPYYAGLMLVARWFRVPVFMYSQGVGPLNRPWLRALAGRVAAIADEVTVRDRQSYDTLRQLGVRPERMSVTADPVFGLLHSAGMDPADSARAAAEAVEPDGSIPMSADSRQRENDSRENDSFVRSSFGSSKRPLMRLSVRSSMTPSILASIRSTMRPSIPSSVRSSMRSCARGSIRSLLMRLPAGPLIGVSVRPLPAGERADTDAVIGALAAALQPRLERWDAHVVPLPLHNDSDRPVLKRLRHVLGERVVDWPAEVAPEQLKARDWMELLARFDLCLTMRLHGLIFSAAVATPFVAVSDDPKVVAHVELLGLDGRECLVSPRSLVNQAPEKSRWGHSTSGVSESAMSDTAVAAGGSSPFSEQAGVGSYKALGHTSGGSSRTVEYTEGGENGTVDRGDCELRGTVDDGDGEPRGTVDHGDGDPRREVGHALERPVQRAYLTLTQGTASHLGAALDGTWQARGALRAHLRAAVPGLAARARLTAVRAIRLAESRAHRRQ